MTFESVDSNTSNTTNFSNEEKKNMIIDMMKEIEEEYIGDIKNIPISNTLLKTGVLTSPIALDFYNKIKKEYIDTDYIEIGEINDGHFKKLKQFYEILQYFYPKRTARISEYHKGYFACGRLIYKLLENESDSDNGDESHSTNYSLNSDSSDDDSSININNINLMARIQAVCLNTDSDTDNDSSSD